MGNAPVGYVSGTLARKDAAKLVDLCLQLHSYTKQDGIPWYVRLFRPWKSARIYRARLDHVARATDPNPSLAQVAK